MVGVSQEAIDLRFLSYVPSLLFFIPSFLKFQKRIFFFFYVVDRRQSPIKIAGKNFHSVFVASKDLLLFQESTQVLLRQMSTNAANMNGPNDKSKQGQGKQPSPSQQGQNSQQGQVKQGGQGNGKPDGQQQSGAPRH
jgi:hypothetical protein